MSCLFPNEDVISVAVENQHQIQCRANFTELDWSRWPFLLNFLIQALLIFQQFFREVGYFFNQTSKQLIFIEQPFGVEPTIGFLCWFRMLLLSCFIFIFGKITISFKLLLTQFCSLEGAFHLHFTKAQEQAPSESDWSSLNHKLEHSWTPWPVYKRIQ